MGIKGAEGLVRMVNRHATSVCQANWCSVTIGPVPKATNSSDDSGIAYCSGIVELNFGACQP